jgi:hypothetical protein
MKKIIAFLFFVILLFGLSGCTVLATYEAIRITVIYFIGALILLFIIVAFLWEFIKKIFKK